MERFRARLAAAFLVTRRRQDSAQKMLALLEMSWAEFQQWLETEALPAAEQGLIAPKELAELRKVTKTEFELEIAQGQSLLRSLLHIKPH